MNLRLKYLFFPQSPPHQRIKASPPERRRTSPQSINNRPENWFW